MKTPSIIIDRDSVTIEGVRVPRPARMSPMQWMNYWGESSNQEGRGTFQRGPSLLPDHNP